MADSLTLWLDALGYSGAASALHRTGERVPRRHPFAFELDDLLSPRGEIGAHAVFDVEGVPTVCFFVDDGSLLNDSDRLMRIRQRIWNQNLVSIILIVTDNALIPCAVSPKAGIGEPLPRRSARRDGPLSVADVQSGQVRDRYPDWFRIEDRVDRRLLKNLRITVSRLAENIPYQNAAKSREAAQFLVGQVLFISYLEHRGIIGDTYRQSRDVEPLAVLIKKRNRLGLEVLLHQLKKDFNGDFLDVERNEYSAWLNLSEDSFDVIENFLAQTDLESNQKSFWPYNFRYIPVELISGIYESFLGESKRNTGSYYTPRHLASLVVDQALSESKDVLSERIYDGACGSGILLTTAFRRLIGEAESRRNRQLTLIERIEILRNHIFGSDVNEMACRVTAFSLYLSLLEKLEPSDIAELCNNGKVKLPTLRGKNLYGGREEGEFFSKNNPLAGSGEFTLFLCNPPWVEPKKNAVLPSDKWAEENNVPRSLRQLAADFAWRAVDSLVPDGRLCLILPMSLLLKPTSQSFITGWLGQVCFKRVINFGDLKELLFDNARFSCVVVLAQRRPEKELGTVPGIETFEYWVPKADISLAFGRLTLHSGDRHVVQTQDIARSNRRLTTLMWGDDVDLALWGRLRLRGTLGDMFGNRWGDPRWIKRKGFHRTDSGVRGGRSTKPLWQMPFIRPEDLYHLPVLDQDSLRPFPKEDIPFVPRLSDKTLQVFHGPRILFPDGPSPSLEIRAAFVRFPSCFMSSIGVIAGPPEDEDLLRFAAVYLRSNLARYFLLTQAYQLLSDRDRVALKDVMDFPFFPPERHPNPSIAQKIVQDVSEQLRALESFNPLVRRHKWEQVRPELEEYVQAYFGLTLEERQLVQESVNELLPAVRPYGMSAVFKRAERRVGPDAVKLYTNALLKELREWRNARGGAGDFLIESWLTNVKRAGPYGVVKITVQESLSNEASPAVRVSDKAVESVLEELRQHGLLPMKKAENIYFAPDTVIDAGASVYFVKPLAPRLWLRRQAIRDAERVVAAVTAHRGVLRGAV